MLVLGDYLWNIFYEFQQTLQVHVDLNMVLLGI